MRREGRQHGMVRTCMILPSPLNPRPNSRVVNELNSLPTAGMYTKVSRKPTNHSKYTSKCGKANCEGQGCHTHPVCKSKAKAKGTQKFNSGDVAKNHRLVSWRVVDKGDGLKYDGKSATGILFNMSNDQYLDDEIEDDANDDNADDVYDDSPALTRIEIEEDNGNMDFYDVGLVLEAVEDEDWCIVEEI
ncbi:histone-lysine N-methyltransferase trithorax-like protein [Thalictrum thalictroides]|uniref:Histone-lysine N-methyltransferase trithorax-like protein n=1 Tax=Thalictrum thalictroides TaxID=46969 RepID=A0A7J6VWR4_THATH|nr:histone-lysine N-methyltransferase trithorax-like protein [Thalictrum thalictroides]